jgi:hypothetical protein
MIKTKSYIISVIMLSFLLIISLPATASATSYKLLDITGYAQEMDKWCWAACEQSILNYFGFSPLPSQYQIVGTVYNPPVNQGANAMQVTNSLGAYGCGASYNAYGIDFSAIQNYINGDSPMIACRSGHATLIRGYYYSWPTSQQVYYIDPWPSSQRYQWLPYTNYNTNWQWTVKDIWYY